MRHLLLLFMLGLICKASYSQLDVKLEDVAHHVGDSVKVCGKVSGVRYLENAKDQPTFINLGAAYPNQSLTVVIWGSLRKEFDKSPEELFRDKNVCIIGTVTTYKDKPQVVLKHKWQIGIE